MPLNRLARHKPFSPLAYRTFMRMSSTIVGQSGRVYTQGEVLQRHHGDHKLSIFKAEYVSNTMSLSHLRQIFNPSHSGLGMNLLFSSACLGHSTFGPNGSQPSLQTPVGFECTLIATQRKGF